MGKLILIAAIFLFVGGYMIYSASQPDIETTEGKKNFIVEFFQWLFHVGTSTKNTVGYAIQQDWLPNVTSNNSTNTTR